VIGLKKSITQLPITLKKGLIEKKPLHIGEYLRIISECDIMCALELWKKWQNHLPGLAKIAKKY